jgi:hypothetical protein
MSWRRRFLAWVTPVLLLAQLALAVHQLEHRIAPDALTVAHECVLCSVTSGAAPPPVPFVILPPDFGRAVPVHAAFDTACCTQVAAAFQSRAPPTFVAL